MILLIQWKAAYTAIAEYKTLASGGTWDDEKGADIALEMGRRVLELCSQKAGGLACMLAFCSCL